MESYLKKYIIDQVNKIVHNVIIPFLENKCKCVSLCTCKFLTNNTAESANSKIKRHFGSKKLRPLEIIDNFRCLTGLQIKYF